MKRIFTVTVVAVLVALTAGYIVSGRPVTQTNATVRADEAAPCSLATVAGNYGFTLTGTLLFPNWPGSARSYAIGDTARWHKHPVCSNR